MLCHPYCKPFWGTWKEFFCHSGKFFCQTRQPDQGKAEQTPQKGRAVRQAVQQGAHQEAARGEKIGRRAQAGRRRVEQAHPAVPPGEGIDEQGGGGGEPEEGVRRVDEPEPAQAVAQQAQDIVQQAEAHPQQRRAAHHRALEGYVDAHAQPKRREKKPVRSRGPSSS